MMNSNELSDGVISRAAQSGISTLCNPPCGPEPTEQHAWLQRFVGEWDAVIEMILDADEPPMTTRGREVAKMVGGFWLVSDAQNFDLPYTCRLTLGYDQIRAEYIGTWVDSMTDYLWHYRGHVDATGQVLTLETEGPFPPTPGETAKFREVTVFKSPDHRQFTSARLQADGSWIRHLKIDFHRR
ncbi:MAG: DUF1579 domain-containing protein [Opitutus sp.]